MTNEQLVAMIKDGIDVSDNMLKLWQQNQGFIGKLAYRYRGYEDVEDLKQQGYIGLSNAVEGYRASEGVPFINYAALWIRQGMVRYIESCGSTVRLPSHERQRQGKYKRLVHDFEAQVGRKPTDWEICRCMQVSHKVLEEMRCNAGMGQIGSLDRYIGEEGETTVGDLLPGDDNVEEQVVAAVDAELLRRTLWPIVDALPGNQGTVLRARYQEGATLKETGERLGVTLERIRIIEKHALRNIRRSRNARLLRPFLPEQVEGMAYRHNGVREFERTWTSSTELAALKL